MKGDTSNLTLMFLSLLVLVLWMPSTSAGMLHVQNISMVVSAPATYMASSPAAYVGQAFNLSVMIDLRAESLQEPASLQVELYMPGVLETYQDCTDTDEYLDGGARYGQCDNITEFHGQAAISNSYYSIASYINVTSGAAIISAPPSIHDYQHQNGTITLNWQHIDNLTEAMAPSDYQITIVYGSVKFQDTYAMALENQFNASAVVTSGNTSAVYEANHTVSVYRLGPQLTMQLLQPIEDLQAGDRVNLLAFVSYDDALTTEEAGSVTVMVQWDDATGMDLVASSYSRTAPLYSSSLSLSEPLHFTNFSLSSSLMVNLTFIATDELPLHTTRILEMDLSWTPSSQANMTYHNHGEWYVHTRSVNFTDVGNDQMMADQYAVGSSVTLMKHFTMPRGSLYLQFRGEFTTSDIEPNVPLMFTASTMSVAGGVIVSPSLESVDASGFLVSNNRRKKRHLEQLFRSRRSPNGLDVTRDFGVITNPVTGGSTDAPVDLTVTFEVTDPSSGGDVSSKLGALIDDEYYLWQESIVTVEKPVLVFSKVAEVFDDIDYPTTLRINFSVVHDPASNAPANNTSLHDGNSLMGILWRDSSFGPGISITSPELSISSDSTQWTWTKDPLNSANSMFISLLYQPANDGGDLGDIEEFTSTVRYTSDSGGVSWLLEESICIEVTNDAESSVVYNYGFTVLVLLVGLILGILLVLLIIFLIIKFCHCYPFSKVEPYEEYDQPLMVKNIQLVMHTSEVTSRAKNSSLSGYDNMKSMTMVGVSDSIVKVLAIKENSKVKKELDSLDIVNASVVDADLEKERNHAIITATFTLLQNMEKNGDLSDKVSQQNIHKFKRAASDLDKKLDTEYKNEVAEIYMELSKKNRSKLDELLAKQEQRREQMEEKLSQIPQKERDELMEELQKEAQAEQEELNSLLQLEQTERVEAARKEVAVRKHLALAELQQDTMTEVKQEGQLSQQQADWMMQEHINMQVELKRISSEEMARQQLLLNEKLERRKLLAQQLNAQNEYHKDLIDTSEKHEIEKIKKMAKNGELGPDQADVMIAKSKEQTQAIRQKLDREKQKHAEDLHKKLNDRKKKRLEEKMKQQQGDLQALDKKHKEMQESKEYVEPISIINERQSLISNHRAELTKLENGIDQEQAEELNEVMESLVDTTRKDLEGFQNNVTSMLQDEGINEEKMEKILRKHEKEMAELETFWGEEKTRQQENFKEALAKRRSEWNQRKERELRDQAAMQAQEEKVVRKLMDNKVSMSEEERERVMKEHEKHVMKLEASLTLNKLQQQRMVEEKIAEKKERRMRQLRQQQQMEAKKAGKKASADSDLDEEEKHEQEIALLRKQAEERQKVREESAVQDEEDMAEIEQELMKEREEALKEQEVKLGAMLASLQLNKAKEMSRIEEQQMAIHNLKSNLMEDLNEKGILSDPECQKVLEHHQKEQEQLAEKMESQRTKQEKLLHDRIHRKMEERALQLQQQHEEAYMNEPQQALKKRLQQRLKQKETNLAHMHETQMSNAVGKATTPAAKIRRMALLHKQQEEMNQFRNRMDKEIDQTLAELRRQNDIRRMQAIQDQEIQFINGLVRMGKFKLDELVNVVEILFPTKSEQEKKALLDALCEGYQPKPAKNPERVSSLVERVKTAKRRQSIAYDASEERGPRKKAPLKNKRKPLARGRKDDEYSERPEPVGRSHSPDYEEPAPRPSKLAPIQTGPKKKKKKKPTYNDDDGF